MFGWKTNGAAPVHRAAERSGIYDGGAVGAAHGMMAGTRIASNLGWREVDKIAVGDEILTFDNGMQKVTDIRRTMMWIDATSVPERMWPLRVPANAIGNRVDLLLLPDQGAMIECESACDAQGDPFGVVPAHTLEGLKGIHRIEPRHEVELVTIYFDTDEVVYVEGGLLLYCPRNLMLLSELINGKASAYEVLGDDDAALLVAALDYETRMLSGSGYAFAAGRDQEMAHVLVA